MLRSKELEVFLKAPRKRKPACYPVPERSSEHSGCGQTLSAMVATVLETHLDTYKVTAGLLSPMTPMTKVPPVLLGDTGGKALTLLRVFLPS